MTSPALSTLTPSQQVALDHLLAAVAAKTNTALHGPAGTGKTTLTGVLIQRLLEQGKTLTGAGPTHKAVRVLRSKVPDGVNCCTVASLLGLKPVAKGRFIQFIPDFKQAERRRRVTEAEGCPRSPGCPSSSLPLEPPRQQLVVVLRAARTKWGQ